MVMEILLWEWWSWERLYTANIRKWRGGEENDNIAEGSKGKRNSITYVSLDRTSLTSSYHFLCYFQNFYFERFLCNSGLELMSLSWDELASAGWATSIAHGTAAEQFASHACASCVPYGKVRLCKGGGAVATTACTWELPPEYADGWARAFWQSWRESCLYGVSFTDGWSSKSGTFGRLVTQWRYSLSFRDTTRRSEFPRPAFKLHLISYINQLSDTQACTQRPSRERVECPNKLERKDTHSR